jgi:hypothetical protein
MNRRAFFATVLAPLIAKRTPEISTYGFSPCADQIFTRSPIFYTELNSRDNSCFLGGDPIA